MEEDYSEEEEEEEERGICWELAHIVVVRD